MTRDEAKDYIRGDLENYLNARKINTRKNFKCLVKEHEHDRARPGMSYNAGTNKAHCFKCNSDYDTFDLIGAETGRTGLDLFNYAYSLYNLDVDGAEAYDTNKAPVEKPRREEKPTPQIRHYDFTDLIEKAHQDGRARPYFRSRGLTDEIIDKYKLGYADSYNALLKDYPELQSKSKKEGLYNYILPYLNNDGTCSYFLAEISDRSQVDEWNGKYRKMKAALDIDGTEYSHPAHIFNERYLKGNSPKFVFVCEGIYDALSYETAGIPAVAFIGTGHVRFLTICKHYRPGTHFIITLDNDGPGSEATEKVKKGLSELGMAFTIANPATKAKDANEALTTDKESFIEAVQMTVQEAQEAQDTIDAQEEAEREAQKADYLKTSAASHLPEFMKGIDASVNTPCIPTGFYALDRILDGGLYEGLYIIGAISSLGKTSFVLQIADQIAQSKQDILIFSLEMARTELMAKSISRLTILNATDPRDAKTARGITDGKRYLSYSKAEGRLISEAMLTYGKYAEHIYINEGMGDIGVKEIRDMIAKHTNLIGSKPVVIIDYLQILAPAEPRATDKQNMDKAVMELKRISRDYKLPVIAISSFNRASYDRGVKMEAFKESGAIEYSSDVLMGMQFKGVAENNDFDIDEAKRKDPRDIEVKILKNRNGATGDTIPFQFYQRFSYFKVA